MVSVEPFIWKDLQKTVSMTKLLKCEPRSKQDVTEPFYIQVAIFVQHNKIIHVYCLNDADNCELIN